MAHPFNYSTWEVDTAEQEFKANLNMTKKNLRLA